MYDFFQNFGTALYLRRGMQKRAFYAKKAVDYLEKVGALEPEMQMAPMQAQPQQYTPLQAAGTAAAGIGAGLASAGALYGAGRLANAVRGRRIENAYNNALGKQVTSISPVPNETAAGFHSRVINGAGEGMARKMHDVDSFRNAKKLEKLKKLRNPLLMGGALAGSALASKMIFGRAKASAQS